MIVVLVILGICLIVETVILTKQLQREQRLEDIINRSLGKLDLLQEIIEESGSILNENPRLKEAFAHDDEVGSYFKKLTEMQKVFEEPFREVDENEEK